MNRRSSEPSFLHPTSHHEATPLLGTSFPPNGRELNRHAVRPYSSIDSEGDFERAKSFSSGIHSHWLAPDVAEDQGRFVETEEEGDEVQEEHFHGGVGKAKFWAIFSGLLLQYFAACFDSTLMASSHPVITSYFHASNAASWLSTAFLITAISFQPLYGRVSDTIGRRPLHLFSLIVFATTTAWCGLAQSIGSFIAARAACGLGAGGIMVMGSIMTNDLVPIERRGTFQAYINLLFGLGSVCGAAFGGFLCDTIGWRWTFGIQVPFIFCLLVLAYFTSPNSLGPHLAKHSEKTTWELIKGFDLAGSFFLSLSVATLILGLNLGGNIYPWKHPFVIASVATSAVSGVILIWVESKAVRPVMPLTMLSTRPRANLIFSNFFGQIGNNAIIFNVPLYFQAVLLDSPSASGFRLAGPSLLITICGVSSGVFITHTGRMTPMIISGSVFMIIGGVCLSSMWDGIPKWLATLFVIPTGMGMGLAFPATMVAVLATSAKDEGAVATATLSLWRSLGVVMGIAVSSLILQNALSTYLYKFVTGPGKEEIILQVRKSVRAIFDLSPQNQRQVMDAYEQSLRWAFISATVAFAIVAILVFPVRLPRLGRR